MVMVLSGLFVVLVAAGRASGLSSVIRRYSDLGGQPYALSRDGRSLVVNGSRVLLLSGSIHYVRSTPEMWPQLFAEARANGLNAIESYVFWNAHAPTRSGPYDYSGNRNVTRFLSLAAEHDLFVLWRFGPYVCAEWPGGGVPAWIIRDVPGMRTRTNNSAWLAETGKWMRAHFAVVEPYLSRNGGPIIASQIENEYGRSCTYDDPLLARRALAILHADGSSYTLDLE